MTFKQCDNMKSTKVSSFYTVTVGVGFEGFHTFEAVSFLSGITQTDD